jgi:hypothetical protein
MPVINIQQEKADDKEDAEQGVAPTGKVGIPPAHNPTNFELLCQYKRPFNLTPYSLPKHIVVTPGDIRVGPGATSPVAFLPLPSIRQLMAASSC